MTRLVVFLLCAAILWHAALGMDPEEDDRVIDLIVIRLPIVDHLTACCTFVVVQLQGTI